FYFPDPWGLVDDIEEGARAMGSVTLLTCQPKVGDVRGHNLLGFFFAVICSLFWCLHLWSPFLSGWTGVLLPKTLITVPLNSGALFLLPVGIVPSSKGGLFKITSCLDAAWFWTTLEGYYFILDLNVIVLGVAGFLGTLALMG
ncbi:hypothetical protein ACJX0J_014781, partial [Zea mays]